MDITAEGIVHPHPEHYTVKRLLRSLGSSSLFNTLTVMTLCLLRRVLEEVFSVRRVLALTVFFLIGFAQCFLYPWLLLYQLSDRLK